MNEDSKAGSAIDSFTTTPPKNWLRGGKLHRVDGPAAILPDGTETWWFKGKRHRIDGAAIIRPDGSEDWYFLGLRHRDGGPAIVTPHGMQAWYRHGQFHRVDGAAVIHEDGKEEWYIDGLRHRVDGPAIVYPDGAEDWFIKGKRHRVDAPAIVKPDGTEAWWLKGRLHRVGAPAITDSDGNEQWFSFGKRIFPESEHSQTVKRNFTRKIASDNLGKPWIEIEQLGRGNFKVTLSQDGQAHLLNGLKLPMCQEQSDNDLMKALLSALEAQIRLGSPMEEITESDDKNILPTNQPLPNS